MKTNRLQFLLSALALAILSPGCAAEPTNHVNLANAKTIAPGVLQVGTLAHPRLTESSGITASRRFPGVFWTHNDGGGKNQLLYAVNSAGKTLGEARISGAELEDWEDIASDAEGHLFLADTGNNDTRRTQLAVYQIDEPDPQRLSAPIPVTRRWQIRYPAKPFNCESLFIWRGQAYVISKVFNDERAEIYRFPLVEQKEPAVLQLLARLKIESPVTSADISPDGRLLGLVAKSGAFVYRIDGNVALAAHVKPHQVKFRDEHIEGCTFVPEGLLATAESREIYLFTDKPFHPAK